MSADPAADILRRTALAGGASRGGGGLWPSRQNGVVEVDENDELEFDAERQ